MTAYREFPFRVWLRGARKSQGMTQAELSKVAKISPMRISAIELGRARPSADETRRLFAALSDGKVTECGGT